jgi:predicted DNA-binding transcriptional regulator AlpA
MAGIAKTISKRFRIGGIPCICKRSKHNQPFSEVLNLTRTSKAHDARSPQLRDFKMSQDKLLKTGEVAQRYQVDKRTIYRWQHDANVDFPPCVTINKRKYFSLLDILAWESVRRVAA